MVKWFVLQFEFNQSTRWLEDDKRIAQFVASVASESVRYKTDGAFPLTTVFPIDPDGRGTLKPGETLEAELKEGATR